MMMMMRNTLLTLLSALVLQSRIVNAAYSYADDGDYDGYTVDTSQVVQVCDDSIIEVANITITCDSPYTYYYGNGAKRSSPTCDYGDKATLTVDFTVTEDIDTTIYIQMSAYNSGDEQLFLGTSVDVCSTYVGESCVSAGDYSFVTNMQFQYIDGDESNFVPIWEIAFSDSADGGYDLGGVNIECDVEGAGSYIDWVNIRTNTTAINQVTETFVEQYGILLLTSFGLFALGFALAGQSKGHLDHSGQNPAGAQLLDQEVL